MLDFNCGQRPGNVIFNCVYVIIKLHSASKPLLFFYTNFSSSLRVPENLEGLTGCWDFELVGSSSRARHQVVELVTAELITG